VCQREFETLCPYRNNSKLVNHLFDRATRAVTTAGMWRIRVIASTSLGFGGTNATPNIKWVKR
jgi:3-oxoacyl-(acyl-carrier-protein) synthase